MEQIFHSVKDQMYHSTQFRLVEWNISLSPHENICTIGLINLHYLLLFQNLRFYSHTV